MKFRNMLIKYYAQADDGTQGGDGGAAAYEAMQNNSDAGADNGSDDAGDNHDADDAGDADADGADGADNAEVEDEQEEFLFDGQALAGSEELTDEDDQDGDTELVKRLRAQLRENRQKIKESTQAQQQQRKEIPADMPAKPQMGDEGIDWDPEKYAEALDKWTEDKAAYAAEQERQEAKREEFGKRFNEGQQRYQEERAKALKKYVGYEKAEAAIADLPEPLQAGVMMISKNPTSVVMALARNTDLRKQVEDAYNSDHIALGYLIRDIESRAGSAPKAKQQHNGAPEVKGQNGVANVGQLEALRKKALETGEMTVYLAAKKRKK